MVVPGMPSPAQRATARTTRNWRLAGLLVGTVVAVLAAQQQGLGRGPLMAAPLGALCVLAGVLIGELRVSRPLGAVRSASLAVRRVRDYVPRALGRIVGGATGALALVLLLTTLAGSPDDLGRAGRSLVRRCSAVVTASHGPWPGSYYALPLAVVVVVGLIASAVVLQRVVQRPRQSGDQDVDDALRRSAAASVTAAFGLLVAVPLAGVAGFAAAALGGIDCRPGWWTGPVVALTVLTLASLVLAVWCAVSLIWPPLVATTTPEPLVEQR